MIDLWHSARRLLCHLPVCAYLETFMVVDQRTGEGSNPRITLVVSKSDSNHGSDTTANRTLGLTPAGTICCSNLSLSYYPIHRPHYCKGQRVIERGEMFKYNEYNYK